MAEAQEGQPLSGLIVMARYWSERLDLAKPGGIGGLPSGIGAVRRKVSQRITCTRISRKACVGVGPTLQEVLGHFHRPPAPPVLEERPDASTAGASEQ